MPFVPPQNIRMVPSKDQELDQRMEQDYTRWSILEQARWGEGDIDTRYRCGDTSVYGQAYGNLSAAQRKVYNFNRLDRACNMVSGYQRTNRKSLIAVPIGGNDDALASQYSKALFHVSRNSELGPKFSTAFDWTLTTGMTLIHPYLDFRKDPLNGEICIDLYAYNSFLIDPYFQSPDLSDCRAIWIRKFMNNSQAASIFPNQRNYILNIGPSGGFDGKFQYMPESYAYDKSALLYVDYYWYRTYESRHFLINMRTGGQQKFTGSMEELEALKRQFNFLASTETWSPTVKLGVRINGNTVYHGEEPTGLDDYPFVPMLGYYTPQLAQWSERVRGLVRGGRDAQYLYSRRKVIELDIMESQVNSGMLYKPESLVDPSQVFTEGQGRAIAIKGEAEMSDVFIIPPPGVNPTALEVSKIMGQEINEVLGINEELLGTAQDDKAGILEVLRQGAGLRTLQVWFDQADNTFKILGNMLLTLMQKNFTEEKIQEILGEEVHPEFFDELAGRYLISVEEGSDSVSQRQLNFKQLLYLKEMGIPIPTEEIIRCSTLQEKDKLIEAIEQEQQRQSQQAQQQEQTQQQVIQAQVQNLQAQAKANAGLAVERASRVDENRALAEERRAAAIKDDQMASLTLAKTIKELDGIDINQLQQLVQLAHFIKMQSQVQAEQEYEREPSGRIPVQNSSQNVQKSSTPQPASASAP